MRHIVFRRDMGKAVEGFRSMMNWEKGEKGKTIGDSAGEDMNDLKEFSKSSQLLFTIKEATSHSGTNKERTKSVFRF